MEDMKFGLDINYMRTAHYPNDPSVYYFMDRNGICINEELPNIKNQNFSKEVQEQNCREMIRRDRNHPSIVIWSMGNETDHACDSRYAVEEDPTRIITVRQPYNDSYNPEFCKHTDKEMPVESYLRCTIRGWYDKDDMNLEPSDGQWAGTEYWQHKLSRNPKKPISEHNGTVWLYADHGADREYVGAPLKHINPKGWVDSWRTPKYVYLPLAGQFLAHADGPHPAAFLAFAVRRSEEAHHRGFQLREGRALCQRQEGRGEETRRQQRFLRRISRRGRRAGCDRGRRHARNDTVVKDPRRDVGRTLRR